MSLPGTDRLPDPEPGPCALHSVPAVGVGSRRWPRGSHYPAREQKEQAALRCSRWPGCAPCVTLETSRHLPEPGWLQGGGAAPWAPGAKPRAPVTVAVTLTAGRPWAGRRPPGQTLSRAAGGAAWSRAVLGKRRTLGGLCRQQGWREREGSGKGRLSPAPCPSYMMKLFSQAVHFHLTFSAHGRCGICFREEEHDLQEELTQQDH